MSTIRVCIIRNAAGRRVSAVAEFLGRRISAQGTSAIRAKEAVLSIALFQIVTDFQAGTVAINDVFPLTVEEVLP